MASTAVTAAVMTAGSAVAGSAAAAAAPADATAAMKAVAVVVSKAVAGQSTAVAIKATAVQAQATAVPGASCTGQAPIMRPRGPGYGGERGRGWARGQYLPPEARGAMISDFGRYHLRRPPRGYYWYRSGEDYVLASTASGVIFEVIPGDGY